MASPFANYGSFFDVEYRVNGVWNYLLHLACAPQLGVNVGQWVICAEPYPNPGNMQGVRLDFSVNQLQQPNNNNMAINYAHIAFEGKGGNSQKSFSDIYTQLTTWLQAGHGNNHLCWVVGAKGNEVAFWCWYVPQGANAARLKGIFCDPQTGQVRSMPGEGWRRYDITKNVGADRWQLAAALINHIATNVPAPPPP